MNDQYNKARRIAESIPPVPANDGFNRNWRSVRLWAETYSKEIVSIYDIVNSKTIAMRLLKLRSMGPLNTALLIEGRFGLLPDSYRSRSRARSMPQQINDVGLKEQMAGLLLELKRTRKYINRLYRRLGSATVDRHHRKKHTSCSEEESGHDRR